MHKVAVIATEIGTRSEVWMIRQMSHFKGLAPTMFGWTKASAAIKPAEDMRVRYFSAGDPRKVSFRQKIWRKLGLAAGHYPALADRARIRAEIEAFAPDFILCHFAWNAIALAPSIPEDIPLIVQVHGRDVSAMLKQPGYRRALAKFLPRVDFLVAVSAYQLRRLQEIAPLPPHEVIPCGGSTELFAKAPIPVRADGEPVRFVSVGRISHEKGVLESLAAFEIVHQHHPDATLTYCGEGPQEGELDAAIAASPARSAIHRLGYCPPERLAEVLSASHVLVQHSQVVNGWVEGFGVTLTEGGASGLPLVASRIGGIPEQLMDGHNGFLFACGDVQAQARAMLRLAEDEKLRFQMGRNARQVAERFDEKRMSARLERVITGQRRHAANAVGRLSALDAVGLDDTIELEGKSPA